MKKFIVLASILVFIAGCADDAGDDNGEGFDQSELDDSGVSITENNAVVVATEVFSGIDKVLEITETWGSFLVVPATATETPLARGFIASVAELLATGNVAETAQCRDGGTMSIQITDVGQSGFLSVDDSVQFQFDDCRDDVENTLINGELSVDVTAVEGNIENEIAPFRFVGDFDFNDFQVESCCGSDEPSLSADGEMIIEFRSENIVTTDTRVTGDSLQVQEDADSTTHVSYEFWRRVLEDTDSEQSTFDGGLENDIIGGRVNYETTTDFEASGNDEHPASGDLVITGTDNSNETVTALDSRNVRIEVDADDDGASDRTFEISWDDLLED